MHPSITGPSALLRGGVEALRLYPSHLISASSLLLSDGSQMRSQQPKVIRSAAGRRSFMLSSCSLYKGWVVAHFSEDLYEASTCAV